MSGLERTFVHLRGVLQESDLAFLRERCRAQLREEHVSCYALLDHQDAPTALELTELVREAVGAPVHYLNDFYLHSDAGCSSGWHTDTELYTFARALNAWVPLAPERVAAPLQVLRGVNEDARESYHTIAVDGDVCELGNLCTGASTRIALETVEARAEAAPDVELGDVLLFDPCRFHRTSGGLPRHCHVTKFVVGDLRDCLSDQQVPELFWPEVGLLDGLVRTADTWADVLEGLRRALRDEEGRRALTAGFYPDRFPLYERAVEAI